MGKESQKPDKVSRLETSLDDMHERLQPNEDTLVIVKPDGVAKGLVGEIVSELDSHSLEVVDTAYMRLDRVWVEKLYQGEREEVYFEEVVAWVSSSSVLFMKIHGPDAINLVKWDIIGRYPNGIRGRYSENWIQNVAHAPDSPQSAQRELEHAETIFEMRRKEDKERFRGIKVFALTGMSESGKSTVGEYLESRGIPRLKIGKMFEQVKNKYAPDLELEEFVKRGEERNPYELWDLFIDELTLTIQERGVDIVSIESLYGGGFGPYLKQRMGDNFDIVYVDIPREVRLQRQMIREGLSTVGEAEKFLAPRDKIKADSGIPAFKESAGEILDNSGTIEDLHAKVDEMIQRHRDLIERQQEKGNTN